MSHLPRYELAGIQDKNRITLWIVVKHPAWEPATSCYPRRNVMYPAVYNEPFRAYPGINIGTSKIKDYVPVKIEHLVSDYDMIANSRNIAQKTAEGITGGAGDKCPFTGDHIDPID